MSIQLYSEFLQPVPLFREIPVGHPVQGIASAKHWYARESGNDFIMQDIAGEEFSVRFDYFHIPQKASFTVASPETIFLQISMFETLQYDLAGYGPVTMHQRGYNLFTVPSYTAHFKKDKRALIIPVSISLSAGYLKAFLPQCPQLKEFLDKAEKGQAATLYAVPQIASTEMLAMVDLVIECGNDRYSDPEWINIYVSELLRHALRWKPRMRRIRVEQSVIERIYEVEGLLDEPFESNSRNGTKGKTKISSKIGHAINEDEEWFDDLRMQDLASYVGMSVYSLSKTFKDVFGYSLSNYKKEAIWQAVLVMLARGIENMKTIASLAGYNDHPSFSRAFKKRFGTTASEYVQELSKKLDDYKKTANRNHG